MDDMIFGTLLGGFAATVLVNMAIFVFLEIHDNLKHKEEE